MHARWNLGPFLLLLCIERSLGAQESDVIEEIIVTGEKLGRTTFESGSSAAILTEEDIRSSTAANITDVFASIPNIAIEPSNGEMIIRGIPRGGFGGPDGTVSYFMDGGPYLASPRYTTIPTWDLQQIEVLRGAQSTAPVSTVAGIVSLVPNRPTDYYEGQIALQYAPEGNQRSAGLAWGGPLGDTLAFRLAGHAKFGDGHITNVATDDDAWNSEDRRMLRLGLSWDPAGMEDTSFRLVAQFVDETIDGAPWINQVNPTDGFDPFSRQVDKDLPITTDNEVNLFVFNVDHQINDQWDWDTTITYHTLESSLLDALSPMVSDPTNGRSVAHTDFEISSLESRVTYGGSTWDIVASLYVAGLTFELAEDLLFDIPFGPLGVAEVTRSLLAENEQNRLGALLMASREFNERWLLDIGLRYQWADPETTGTSAAMRTGSTGDPMADAAIDQIIAASASPTSDVKHNTYAETMPIFSLSYSFSDSLTIGGKIESGMRWGAQSVNIGQQQVYEFDPERATSFELFWRQITAGGDLSIDANIFYTEFRDQQVVACFSSTFGDCHIVNAQKSRSQGLELNISWLFSEDWSLRAGAGINETEFEQFEVGDIDWTGNEMPSPDQSYLLGLVYQKVDGLFSDFEVLYESDAYATPANDPQILRDRRLLLNARVGWRAERWEASLFGRNLLDEEYFSRVSYDLPGGLQQMAFPGDPRVVGLELRANW